AAVAIDVSRRTTPARQARPYIQALLVEFGHCDIDAKKITGVGMKSDSGQTVSVWMATADLPECQPLSEKITADVCIIGSGMAGMSTAYLLSREGKKV